MGISLFGVSPNNPGHYLRSDRQSPGNLMQKWGEPQTRIMNAVPRQSISDCRWSDGLPFLLRPVTGKGVGAFFQHGQLLLLPSARTRQRPLTDQVIKSGCFFGPSTPLLANGYLARIIAPRPRTAIANPEGIEKSFFRPTVCVPYRSITRYSE